MTDPPLHSPTRFITETSLDYVARRLRFLGYDVETVRGARLEELLALARDSGRIVLTPSDRHPRAFASVAVMVVPREAPEEAVRVVAGRFVPEHAPFTRCAHCNVDLVARPASEAPERVPAAVRAGTATLMHCPRCHRWYWHGSHVDRVRLWLEHATGTSVPGPLPHGS